MDELMNIVNTKIKFLILVIVICTQLQCLIALGYGRQKPRLSSWSLIDEKELLIPSNSFETQETYKVKNYTIDYQKGKWKWLFHGLFTVIPLPIPFFIPNRMQRVVIYERGIPIEEFRTTYDYEFRGLACNYIFPLVGRGCDLKFDKGYYPEEPEYTIQVRKLIYNYVQVDDLIASNNMISFHFLKGIDQNEKSCSYQGKLEIFKLS